MGYPIPSLEKPFGVKLWPLFDEAVTRISSGKVVPSDFEFVAGETFMSTLPPVAFLIGFYYLVVFGGRALIRRFQWPALVLNGLFQIHNFFLTSLSLTLLVLLIDQLVPMISQHGLYFAICSTSAWTQPMITLYYLNYLTKFVEFIDTVFLVVKQKKLTFLHTYHHGATALLCYTQLNGVTSISWVPISLNLGVHVVMYWYYFLAARGIRVWWKEWVTRFQIIQFILDLGFVYFATLQKIIHTYYPELPHCGDCAGTMLAAYSGCAILSSYLVLFIAFYIEVYKKKGSKKAKVLKRVPGGVANKVNEYVLLDSAHLATGFDSNSGSPLPPKNRRKA
ncbi:unnamed protein product [Kuraishia capsulata CBS 1993]|uniref:Elongation of fatty acids protein n=1 Tax=Kuraishia capsulata CBS 1993 TaxID=1382522 RepID=W6MGX3_9ASCO|nr:uncharacterized protein KUCA_T00001113001 [Kuraishia capsulata CBS 1993]CDK25146.1 unnamed protein product [Kuraishia capsulata CBS 1993]